MDAHTTILSSQRYLDAAVVATKKAALVESGASTVAIQCSSVGTIDGVEYAIVVDGHHLMCAARELGLSIEFVIGNDPEGLTGDRLLEARYIDSAYYNVATGIDEF